MHITIPWSPRGKSAPLHTNDKHLLLLWFIVTLWVQATMSTTQHRQIPINLEEKRLMLWLYVVHSTITKRSTALNLASCAHVHWHYALKKPLYTVYPTPYGREAFTSREEPLSLWSFVLKSNTEKVPKYIEQFVNLKITTQQRKEKQLKWRPHDSTVNQQLEVLVLEVRVTWSKLQ